MGKFKDQGDPVLALAEECAELIQVITKKYRFSGDSLNAWKDVPEGATTSRINSFTEELEDVKYQMDRALKHLNSVLLPDTLSTLDALSKLADFYKNQEDDLHNGYDEDDEYDDFEEYTDYCGLCEMDSTYSKHNPYGTCKCS
jgi:hypothetical protein